MTGSDAATAVTACGHAARAAAPHLAAAPAEAVNAALHGMAGLLGEAAPVLLAANAADVAAGAAAGLGRGLLDRLTLGEARIAEMARQISLLADGPFPARATASPGPSRRLFPIRTTRPGRCDRRQLRGPP